MIKSHFDSVKKTISELEWLADSISVQSEFGPDDSIGIISGIIVFKDGSTFHFKEVHLPASRKYRFHYMNLDNQLICRWDNAPHHHEIETFPDHVHFPNEIRENAPMDLLEALRHIEEQVSDWLSNQIDA